MVFPLAAALIGSAVIGGGASIIGASAAASASKKATEQNNTLAREQYATNSANLRPFIDQGSGASSALYDQVVGQPDYNAYLASNPDVMKEAERAVAAGEVSSPQEFARQHYERYGKTEGRQLSYTGQSGPDVGERPTFNRPSDSAAPTFSRGETTPFKFGAEEYVETPGFQFQQERGMGALKSDLTLKNLLRTGKAVKSALEFSQNLAMQDFTGERAFAYDQYSDEQARRDAQFETDRGYGADAYRYSQGRQDSNYLDDRNFGTGTWEADRSYATNRYDTRTGNLLNLSQQGAGAASALAGVGQNYVNNVSANNNNQAGVTANAALSAAGTVNNTISDAAYTYGRMGSSYAPQASTGGGYDYMSGASNNWLRGQG